MKVKVVEMPSDVSILKAQLREHISTLHETSCGTDSKNSNKLVYLCHSSIKVYNFDDITKAKFPSHTSSFDALYFIENKEVYCIEFKNLYRQQLNNNADDKKKIQEKYIEGLNSLNKMFSDNNIPIKNYKFYFFLVYKDTDKQKGREYVKEAETQNQIKFGLKEAREKNIDKLIFKNSHIKTTCKSCFKQEYEKLKNSIHLP